MQLDSMKPAPGSRKNRKRIGRGPGSGTGKTAARGHKGQGSRTGGGSAVGFEGGQMPLSRRLPKRGFNNPTRCAYQVINLADLADFDSGAVVDLQALRGRGLARRRQPIKILGVGTLDKAITVKADAFSRSAREAIEKVGGTATIAKTASATASEKE